MMRIALISLAMALTASHASAAAPGSAIASAVADTSRPAADQARDGDRKPAEMLAFAGVRPGMAIVDLMPGSGYFTRLFSDAVGPTGKVVGYVPDEILAKYPKSIGGVTAVAAEPAHHNVQVLHDPLLSPGPENVFDLVWTSQNYHDLHNLANVDVVAFDRIVYRMLRPGGVFVVLDHSAPAGSGLTDTNTLHRIDAAVVRKEVEAAGFVYDGATQVLANPGDPRTANVFDSSIRGHTDQFALRFRKPG